MTDIWYSTRMDSPVSVNTLYGGKARRYRSAFYEAFLRRNHGAHPMETIGFELPIHLPCRLEIHLIFPDQRKRDAANYEKAISDLLVKRGILEDDSLIVQNLQTKRVTKGAYYADVFIMAPVDMDRREVS